VKHPHSSFHLSSSYSACVITLRTKTFWLRFKIRVTRRYLLPPMLKTTQLPTMLAVLKSAFTSPQECQVAVLLLTCVYHARNGPSAPSWPEVSQNCFSRALEITRIEFCPS